MPLAQKAQLFAVGFGPLGSPGSDSVIPTGTFSVLLCLPSRAKKKSKPLNLKIHSSVGSCENIPSQQRSPLLSERSLRSFFVGHAPFLPSTPPVHSEANFSASKSWTHQLGHPDREPHSLSPAFAPASLSVSCSFCDHSQFFRGGLHPPAPPPPHSHGCLATVEKAFGIKLCISPFPHPRHSGESP